MVVKALGNKINSGNAQCMTYLYTSPTLLVDYLNVWATLNESAIVDATFEAFNVDRAG